MSANPAIHISDPLPLGSSGRVPGNKGIWVGICCEFVEFLVLFAVYFVARAHFPDAFEQGAQRLSLLSGTLITLLMLSSSYCIACAVATIRQQRRRASIRWLPTNSATWTLARTGGLSQGVTSTVTESVLRLPCPSTSTS